MIRGGAAVLWEWGRTGWSDSRFCGGGSAEEGGVLLGREGGWDDCGVSVWSGVDVGLPRWEGRDSIGRVFGAQAGMWVGYRVGWVRALLEGSG